MDFSFSAIGKTKVNDQDISEIGVRGIFPIGNKIFSGTNLSGFATVGIVNQTIDNDNGTLLGGSVGVEFGFADPIYFTGEVGVSNGISGNSDQGLLFGWGIGMHFYF